MGSRDALSNFEAEEEKTSESKKKWQVTPRRKDKMNASRK